MEKVLVWMNKFYTLCVQPRKKAQKLWAVVEAVTKHHETKYGDKFCIKLVGVDGEVWVLQAQHFISKGLLGPMPHIRGRRCTYMCILCSYMLFIYISIVFIYALSMRKTSTYMCLKRTYMCSFRAYMCNIYEPKTTYMVAHICAKSNIYAHHICAPGDRCMS